ncbi:MAG: DNA polymerase IV [Lautropia sp.]|nr:DNA polymerase IV [Lautropia sp.]
MNSPTPQRRIAHLDMDAFFASVSLLQFPQLKGLPLVIGGPRLDPEALLTRLKQAGADPTLTAAQLHEVPARFFPRLRHYRGRGVITTATYEARQYGLHSAMGMAKAAPLCPDAILLPADFDTYRQVSRRFKQIITDIAPTMEDRGIDEVYIDFTHEPEGQLEGGRVLATRIQSAILTATRLNCSIGVAPNKLLAKMASEFNKPAGISIVFEEDLERLIWPLPCYRINGIGPKTRGKLNGLGVETIGQLAACSPAWLARHFGARQARWLHESAWGRDGRPVETHSEPVSLSRETTFERDLHPVHDRAELGRIFTRLAEQVALDLQRKGYAGRTIGIKLRHADFRVVSRDQTIQSPTQDATRIRAVAGQCLKRVDLSQRLRLLGIRVSSLHKLQYRASGTKPYPMTAESSKDRQACADDDGTTRDLQQLVLDFEAQPIASTSPHRKILR